MKEIVKKEIEGREKQRKRNCRKEGNEERKTEMKLRKRQKDREVKIKKNNIKRKK